MGEDLLRQLVAALWRPEPPQIRSRAIGGDVGASHVPVRGGREQKGAWRPWCDAPTSYHFASGGHFPQNEGHGVDVHLLERLQVFQVHPGLQDLWGHVPGSAHLPAKRREALAGVGEDFGRGATRGGLQRVPFASGSYLPARCWQSRPP